MSFKRKLCKHCRGKLDPERAGQLVHIDCAAEFAIALGEKKARASAKAVKSKDRLEAKERKEQSMSLEDCHKQAQQSFNEWVRWRDRAEDCISCGAYPPDPDSLHAGRDAGHFRSVGAARHLRYNEDNCHAQCVYCNRDKAGNVAQYRVRLALKIGGARIEALENDNRVHKWTREEVLHIRDTYRQKLRELKKTR